MARIALDAMGGDHAPQATVDGALHALAELDPSHTIQLVGRTADIEAGLARHTNVPRDRIEIIEAPDVVAMTDKPSAVLRGKKQSSMVIGIELQSAGRSDAFVSAGNTGAQMAASSRVLGLLPGLERPAIATLFPTAGKPVLVLDSGANVDCSPEELLSFARLGAVYAEDLLGRPNPVIGLLSVGEEDEKGSAAVKAANQLLRASGLNFQGNVEGRDLPRGASDRGPIDVVVCDGFVGNVLLKFYETVAPTIIRMVVKASGVDPEQILRALPQLDADSAGGAPLLGVKGVSIISHGKSNAKAIKNAIGVAVRTVESQMTEHAARRLSESFGSAESR
jgi:glycerol-3-phosphate acyltransferase PlsX